MEFKERSAYRHSLFEMLQAVPLICNVHLTHQNIAHETVYSQCHNLTNRNVSITLRFIEIVV